MDANNIRSSPSLRQNWKYDVFISFRGPDTRNGFVDHLYNHLTRKGIFAFKDDERLEKGEPISSELIQAIKDSRISIVVFSKGYADSKWCLDEMAIIAECKKEMKQEVFPVFYDVDPSHVRYQYGVYRNAFISHTQEFTENPGKVDRWKSAMKELGNLVGWDVRNKRGSIQVEDIVQKVIDKLGHKFSEFADDLIGIQSRVQGLEKLLKSSSEDDCLRVLGIWGMGGIGKTTLTTVLYNRIFHHFDKHCFIENVSKIYEDGCATAIQKQILRQILDEKNLDAYSPSQISGIVTNRLHNIKVLIVLDNVDEIKQLQELLINPKLLQAGSRMIITTRNEHLLKVYGADVIHKVPLLNHNEAKTLLCRKAFKTDDPSSSYMKMIHEVLKYVEGLPLAIRVLGSFLCTRDVDEWRATLNGLQNNPNREVMKVLHISFEGLEPLEREIFLHIACFFRGETVDYVMRILDCCELAAGIGIPVLKEKSLISIRNQEIHMHELLQELGKNIVRKQNPTKPGLWSRLWLHRDFQHVMMSQTGTNSIEAIVLEQKGDVSQDNKLKAGGFSRMKSLKLLILHHKNFSGNLKFLSNSLHYLMWHSYPFASLPPSFQPYRLVELNMPNSNITQLWEGTEIFLCLKRMDLSNSIYLKETPNFERVPNLERLDLTGCTKLSLVHSSIREHQKLAFLSLRNCCSLVSLNLSPDSNRRIRNKSAFIDRRPLRVLQLSGCTKLENVDLTWFLNLEYLDLEQCTGLTTIHGPIWPLSNLKYLSLRGCTNLVQIPGSITTLGSLITLNLCGCEKLTKLHLSQPHLATSLIFLDLGFCNLREIPEAIGLLPCLERLNLQGNKFASLPYSFMFLRRLAYLNLAHCHELQNLTFLPLESASSGDKYFKTVSGSRNDRSGLYIFDCPKCIFGSRQSSVLNDLALLWQFRLVLAPCSFRCGFDIVVPGSVFPVWFSHQFKGDSMIRIVDSDADGKWIGFAFCASFKVNRRPSISGPSHDSFPSPLPHPFYLSFETEEAEETFNMPLRLDLDKIDSSEHLWLIYISPPHCHFVRSGAHITFKAHPDLEIVKWGLRMVSKQDAIEEKMMKLIGSGSVKIGESSEVDSLAFNYVHESKGSSGPKIQLPYNWLVTDEEEHENIEGKAKENDISNVGLTTSHDQKDIASSSSRVADEEAK